MRSALALLAITTSIFSAAPYQAGAAAAEHSYTLATRMVEQAPSVGEYDGSLQLHVSADGVISGYYRPDDNPRFIPIVGGVTGRAFWIDIGSFATHPLRFSGTFTGGAIDAQATGVILDEGRYTGLELIAQPRGNSSLLAARKERTARAS